MSSHQITRRLTPSPPISMDDPSGLRATHHLDTPNVLRMHRVNSCDKPHVTINILPDDVLLLIFHFYRLVRLEDLGWSPHFWHQLIQVCRRWRIIVFASPNSLDLKLVCGPETPVELMGIWPPLPIVMENNYGHFPEDYEFGAAIVHPNRVSEISLFYLTSSELQRLDLAMQEPFPALIHLSLSYPRHAPLPPSPTLTDGFLGGSAPRLQSLGLDSIPFPSLPKLLLSATHLVCLDLWSIPHSGYISPEAIVTCLAVLANLKTLTIEFVSLLSRPDGEGKLTPPPTRTVLPALTRFVFKGVSDYLEDLVARIDAPLLDTIGITYLHQLIFDIPQLAQFMRRTTRFQALSEAHVSLGQNGVRVESHPPKRTFNEISGLSFSCRDLDWRLPHLVQVLTSFFSSIEHLYMYGPRYLLPRQREDDIKNMQWLEDFHPFTTVKNLYAIEGFEQCIASALQKLVGERMTDALPSLENLFLEGVQPSGPVQETIGQFVAARQLLGRPVAVSSWNRT